MLVTTGSVRVKYIPGTDVFKTRTATGKRMQLLLARFDVNKLLDISCFSI